MELKGYNTTKGNENITYEFYSEGPRGKIKKVVSFQHMNKFGRNVFNLAFGDWNKDTGKTNDLVISNNGDRLKILVTIAEAAIDFMECNPKAIILVQGNSKSRTRLYQMGISTYWAAINIRYIVYGEIEMEWMPFRRGVNYDRFLIYKKIE